MKNISSNYFQLRKIIQLCLILLLFIFLSACQNIKQTPSSTQTVVKLPTKTLTPDNADIVITSEVPTLETQTPSGVDKVGTQSICYLGTGLRAETAPILLNYHESNAFVMAGTYAHGVENFPHLPGWFRVLGAPSLETLGKHAQKAEQSGLDYEAIGYGLETGKSTPEGEWQNIIESTHKAREIADQYNKLLAMGPGFKLMSENEEKYPEMASLSDVWILQTQRLQIHPPGPEYRQEVERIVDLIRSGNPDIVIWAQIVLPPDREPDPDYWIAYRDSIKDIVDVTYIGAYNWKTIDDPVKLMTTIDTIYSRVCNK